MKRKSTTILVLCIAIVLLAVFFINPKKNIVSFNFYGQNDYWEVKIEYTINQDSKTTTRRSTLISKVNQPELMYLDITVSDNNSWITTESLELSKGMSKDEEQLNTYGINYEKNIITVDSITVQLLLNNTDKQNILMKRVE